MYQQFELDYFIYHYHSSSIYPVHFRFYILMSFDLSHQPEILRAHHHHYSNPRILFFFFFLLLFSNQNKCLFQLVIYFSIYKYMCRKNRQKKKVEKKRKESEKNRREMREIQKIKSLLICRSYQIIYQCHFVCN